MIKQIDMKIELISIFLPLKIGLMGIFLLVMLLFSGCSEEDNSTNNEENIAINFSLALQSTPAWKRQLTEGDPNGMFMLSGGSMLSDGTISGADNLKYTVSNTGTILPEDNTQIYYPQSDNVDFIAYYPYGEKGSSDFQVTSQYSYNISVSNQSNPTSIDMLYAKSTNIAKSNAPVTLTFSHILSRITLNLKAGDGFSAQDISGLTAEQLTFSGMPVEAILSLQDGSLAANESASFHPLKAETAMTNYDMTFSAIIIPHTSEEYSNRTLVLNISGKEYTWNIPASEVFNKGNNYTYPVTVNEAGIEIGIPTEIPIETVHILAGTFMMGSPTSEGGYLNETQHEVTLTRDFYMSKYEITNTQYADFLNAVGIRENGIWVDGQYPSAKLVETNSEEGVVYNNGIWIPATNKEDNPIVNVTWYGADEFARWSGGSLPTEAQWEYACRAGTTTPYSFGDNTDAPDEYIWYNLNSSYESHPGGEKKPNSWGLYDMHGNVGEWCLDNWDGATAYSPDAVIDPVSPNPGNYRINRGGSWQYYMTVCRSAFRSYSGPTVCLNRIGFRVVFVY